MLLGRNAPSDSELSSYLGSENRLRILARAPSTGGGGEGYMRGSTGASY